MRAHWSMLRRAASAGRWKIPPGCAAREKKRASNSPNRVQSRIPPSVKYLEGVGHKLRDEWSPK